MSVHAPQPGLELTVKQVCNSSLIFQNARPITTSWNEEFICLVRDANFQTNSLQFISVPCFML